MSRKRTWLGMIAFVAAMTLFGAGNVFAFNLVWIGTTDTDWAAVAGANWDSTQDGALDGVADPGRKPLTGDTVTIKPGTLGRLPVVPGGGGASGSITLDTTDGVVSLTCTGTLTIDAGSTVSAIGDASADAATLSGTVTAAGAITFTCSNAGPANGLIISANVTGGAGALIQFTGSENILVSGTLLNGGGNPVTVNMTAETDVVTFSGINTYAGLLTLTQGELVLANAAAEGTGAAGIKLEAGILNLGFGYSDDLGGAITLGQWLKCTNKNHCCLMMR